MELGEKVTTVEQIPTPLSVDSTLAIVTSNFLTCPGLDSNSDRGETARDKGLFGCIENEKVDEMI